MTEHEFEEVARRACAAYSNWRWETVPTSVRARWIAEVRAAANGGEDNTTIGQMVRRVLAAYVAEQEAVGVVVPTQPLAKKLSGKGKQ